MSDIDAKRVRNTLDRIMAFIAGDTPGPLLSVWAEPDYRQQPNQTKMLDAAEACIRRDIADALPNVVPTFIPDFGTVSMPAMWGGTVAPAANGGGIFIEPIIHSADELRHLPAPCSFEQSDFARGLRGHGELCRRLNSEHVYLRTPDLQGPMNTLAMLMDQEALMLALFDEPQSVHAALDQITDALIDCLSRYRSAVGAERVVGNVWPWVILPGGAGVGITQDYMPLLGADQYAEFELPRLKRIADSFGGVFIHCCGEYARHLPALASADFRILGIEMHHPCTQLPEVYGALGPQPVYTPYTAPTAGRQFASYVEYLRSLVDQPAWRRCWICVGRGWMPPHQLRQLTELVATHR